MKKTLLRIMGLMGLLVGAGLLLAVPGKREDLTVDSGLYDYYLDAELKSPEELINTFIAENIFWMPIAPPDMGWLHLASQRDLTVFDPGNFPVWFVRGLSPATYAGCTIYPIYLFEDLAAREIVVANSMGEEIAALAMPVGYDPIRAALEAHGADRSEAFIASLEHSYATTRIIIKYQLIVARELEVFIARKSALEATKEKAEDPDPGGGMKMSQEWTGGSVSNIMITDVTVDSTNHDFECTITYPDDFTNQIDVFSCEDLVPYWWTIQLTTNISASTNWIKYTELGAATNFQRRFFTVGTADCTEFTDPDSDGLPWKRETLVYHTDPEDADSDDDLFTDYEEVITYKTDPNNDDTNKPTAQISFPSDNYEWIFLP